MKIFGIGLFIVLLCTVRELCATNASHVPDECCFSFYPKRLPIKSISHLKTTSSSCPVAGVIFFTKKGYKVCAKANESWVKKYVEHFTQQNSEK
ncbi:C-C motif chemokine 3-like [Erpetoichthys calabaricus]|uniref:C-C motif chemokine 3-like n=1 Tax=Erpetoichthys calabaricus TaxID=27687 RepID=UPI00109F1FD2|nr:C-C motif chemokine 3-like [Erpetoichthys calabaricus]